MAADMNRGCSTCVYVVHHRETCDRGTPIYSTQTALSRKASCRWSLLCKCYKNILINIDPVWSGHGGGGPTADLRWTLLGLWQASRNKIMDFLWRHMSNGRLKGRHILWVIGKIIPGSKMNSTHRELYSKKKKLYCTVPRLTIWSTVLRWEKWSVP